MDQLFKLFSTRCRFTNQSASVLRQLPFTPFATSETRRELGRVSFRKDFWDRYKGRAGQLLADHYPCPQ